MVNMPSEKQSDLGRKDCAGITSSTGAILASSTREQLAMVKLMDATQLQAVLALPVQKFPVQGRVLSAARARLRKIVKASNGAVPGRQPSSRSYRLNDRQREHLLRFDQGLEQEWYQLGKSKATSKALYYKGLLFITEEGNPDFPGEGSNDSHRFDLTEKGRDLCQALRPLDVSGGNGSTKGTDFTESTDSTGGNRDAS